MFPTRWEPTAVFRRDFAWRMLEKWLPLGASANAVLEGLQAFDMGIRRQDFLGIAEVVRESLGNEQIIRGWDRGQVLPAARYTERDWQTSSTYLYRVNVFGNDPTTGEEMEISRLIGSDERLTHDNLQDVVRGLSEPGYEALSLEVRGVQAYGVIVRPGFFG